APRNPRLSRPAAPSLAGPVVSDAGRWVDSRTDRRRRRADDATDFARFPGTGDAIPIDLGSDRHAAAPADECDGGPDSGAGRARSPAVRTDRRSAHHGLYLLIGIDDQIAFTPFQIADGRRAQQLATPRLVQFTLMHPFLDDV